MPELTLLPFAASLLDIVSAIAVVLAAVALGAVGTLLLRRRDPDAEGVDLGGGSVSDQLQAIGTKIDRTIVQQQHQGETARRMLSQKMEAMSEAVEAQGHELSGVRNELRHEVRRRDAELDELRHQLASIRSGALPVPALAALPAASDAAQAVDEPAGTVEPAPPVEHVDESDEATFEDLAPEPEAADLPPAPETVTVEADPFDMDDEGAADEPEAAAEIEPLDALAFEAPVVDAPAPPPEPTAEPVAEPVAGDPFESAGDGGSDGSTRPEPSIFTPISFGPPASSPAADDAAWVARPSTSQAEAVAADPEDVVKAAFPAPEEPTAPEGAEDLTVISSIDESTQTFLYSAGVLTLDDVARIGRSDAQRLGHEVGVSEHTIMNQWVFEAQAALFNRFSRESRS